MALRFKLFTPLQILKADETNTLSNNGVVQVSSYDDLDDADLVGVNLVYVTDEHALRCRLADGAGKDKWSTPFRSRRGSTSGVRHTGRGAFTIDGVTGNLSVASSSAGTATITNNVVTHTGATTAVIKVQEKAGSTVLKTYTMERKPHVNENYTYTTTRDCSYGARAEQYQSGTNEVIHRGDPCQGPYMDLCPSGWWCVQAGHPVNWCETKTYEPIYSTRYHCDSGGSLQGTTCVKTCTDTHTGTRLRDEPGYTNSHGEWSKVSVA